MRWSDTALRRQLRDQEEIKAFILIDVLDKLRVDDGARLRVGGY